jgi:SH3-like domain-containing protein
MRSKLPLHRRLPRQLRTKHHFMQNDVMKKFMTLRMTKISAARIMAAFCLAASLQVLAQTAQPPAPAPVAAATQFVSIGDKPAILYDALSVKANKLFILSRNYPLEVLVKLDKWTKVRDSEGAIGWVENTSLGDKRFVQVSATTAEIRAGAQAGANVVFEAQRGVLLEVTAPAADGWLAVRHRDGQSGFVRATQVWGG